jgi:hypothetical protein
MSMAIAGNSAAQEAAEPTVIPPETLKWNRTPVPDVTVEAITGNAPARAEMPIERLKRAYLECERAAVNGRLATDEIMLCSVLYQELKQRAFDGDFQRLKAWADERLRAPEGRADRKRAAR